MARPHRGRVRERRGADRPLAAQRARPAGAAGGPAPGRRAGERAGARARRGGPRRAVPDLAAGPGRRPRPGGRSSWTTPRPTAPPTSWRRSPAADPRVRLLRGDGPRTGLAGQDPRVPPAGAGPRRVEVLVFVDADVVLAPHAVAAAVDLLRGAGLDLVCPYPRQLAAHLERAPRPAAAAVVVADDPAAAASRSCSPRPSLAAANGQFLARRRRAPTARAAGTRRSAARCSTTSRCCASVKAHGGRGRGRRRHRARDVPDVRRLGRAARGVREVAVVGVRLAAGGGRGRRRPARPDLRRARRSRR